MSAIRNLRNWLTQWRYRINAADRVSYAQCGEDLIIHYIFRAMGKQQVSYLDVGAHHPDYLSNTYYFYNRGDRGVCVEPDAALLNEFKRKRPGDRLLNIGLAPEQGLADFYIMSTPTLNTFSKLEAERIASYGNQKIERIEKVSLRGINEVIAENFEGPPDLLSLDVEGMDLAILQSLDFSRFSPDVCCVETLSYTEDKSERKLSEIIDLMLTHGYFVYADTYINSIFVRSAAWQNRVGAR